MNLKSQMLVFESFIFSDREDRVGGDISTADIYIHVRLFYMI